MQLYIYDRGLFSQPQSRPTHMMRIPLYLFIFLSTVRVQYWMGKQIYDLDQDITENSIL